MNVKLKKHLYFSVMPLIYIAYYSVELFFLCKKNVNSPLDKMMIPYIFSAINILLSVFYLIISRINTNRKIIVFGIIVAIVNSILGIFISLVGNLVLMVFGWLLLEILAPTSELFYNSKKLRFRLKKFIYYHFDAYKTFLVLLCVQALVIALQIFVVKSDYSLITFTLIFQICLNGLALIKLDLSKINLDDYDVEEYDEDDVEEYVEDEE